MSTRKNSKPTVTDNPAGTELKVKEQDTRNNEFKIPLYGDTDLRVQLEEFKKVCTEHEKHMRKRCKRRYYNLGLMARVVSSTTDEEVTSLLLHGARTFLFDIVTNKPRELDELVKRTMRTAADFQAGEPNLRVVIGLALEINGDCCRFGRMRNNCSVLVQRGQTITLTTDEGYRYSCFKEIAYVINLRFYLKTLNLNDELMLGREVRGTVAKLLKQSIAVLITEAGILNSYEYIELPNQCYALKDEIYPQMFTNDILTIESYDAHFLVLQNIRCKPFLKSLRSHLKEKGNLKIIGALDLPFISAKMLDLMGIISLLDYLWVPDMFTINSNLQCLLNEDVLPLAKCLGKPVIGSIPLERCSDFKRFENHDFLFKIDAIFIEKSSWCNKYPLIVKKLLPIRNFSIGVVENRMSLKNILTSYRSIVNFIVRTISSIECQAIFMYTRCETAAVALGRVEIYCPVYVLLPLEHDEEEEESKCKIELARSLNLRRNLSSILYTKEMNICNLKPIDFGVDYLRANNKLESGDFIISIEVGKQDEEDIQYGSGEDVVVLRAFYLPPLKKFEKFMFS